MNVDIFNNVTNLLKSTFPRMPVYPSFGNHDTDVTDQFEPRNTLLYKQAWSRWRSWINDDIQEATCRKGGYYTVKASPYLRIIVLNTILYYKRNKQVTSDGDPAGQFRWLVDALQYARKQEEKVIITAHIPLGVQPNGETELYKHQNDRLIEISNQYSDVIVAMHFGHEHTDAFKVLTDEKGVPTVPIFLAPSVSPLGYSLSHNPGIRLIKYNRITGLHLEIIQYFLDVEAANIAGTASWELEYSTSGAYGLNNLSPGSLFSLINRMKAADSQEFKSFWKHYVVTPPKSLFKECDSKCHARVFCRFSKLTESDFAKCLQEFDVDNIQKFWRWFFRR
ncbi:acid sphingomyelinase-like phosphodiesterase 3a [Ruditapes philippinarum]|uniref:acid sphingomyelinase-like phosphodiesterase 3a n=1 Tax=Ruditapes philippinarum TaxID=129788 RepID=UPI00295B9582|nr:acid sphingomyelinase-like phosphodiesterase 3a [Ruditapes philippinarum]